MADEEAQATDSGNGRSAEPGRTQTPRRLPEEAHQNRLFDCEGYAQRVVFKNPLGIVGPYGPPQVQDDQMQQQNTRVPLYSEFTSLPPQQAAAAARHPMLAPRLDGHMLQGYQYPAPTAAIAGRAQPDAQQIVDPPQFGYPAPPAQVPQQWLDHSAGQVGQGTIPSAPLNYMQIQTQPVGLNNPSPQYSMVNPQLPQPITDWASITHQDYARNSSPQVRYTLKAWKISLLRIYSHSGQQIQLIAIHNRLSSLYSPLPLDNTPRPSQPQIVYVKDEAEDYYDVESDEELEDQTQTEGFNQLSLIMASANHDDRRMRSFTTHLNEPNILSSYHPTLGSSPLNNPKTARIFAHFIHSTAPSLSIFERHPTDSSINLGSVIPPDQQGLWTYTLALKALEHPALLQAILAVSSLHIAYLQEAPTTVSLKHYHYALKRLGRAVGLPGWRKQIGTMAATQLLAYYEVMSADHTKNTEQEDHSEEATYAEAECEWEEILAAMDTYVQALGRDFQPLPADVTTVIDSPFGPAMQYRTHTIAVVWAMYYAGRILLHRLHPCLPRP
ncbi:hypothetical protein N7486_010087 [Penicillium sp. IBT 16267x]|nr:hypothetical protein N7486_010087 [Penicillium sp. IBT 16267x]